MTEVRREARALISLALPAVLAQLSQMSMGFVDTFMVARLGPEPLGAVGVGNVVYFFYLVFSIGTLAAVSPMVAQAFGAGDDREIGRSVGQGAWLAAALAVLGMILAWNVTPILSLFGQEPVVAELAGRYARAMSYGLIGSLLFGVLRGFCDAVNRTRVAMVIAFVALLVNAGADYVLIYGTLGFPALGAEGAGYATAVVHLTMFTLIAFYVLRSPEFRRYRFLYRARRPRMRYIAKILRLGLPMGATHSTEHGFFGVTSLLMGTIGTAVLAAHQVSIILAAVAFMVPMGTSFAVTARVGQAVGRGDHEAAARAGWVGIGLGTLVMCTTAAIFISFPATLATVFTTEPAVVADARNLLMIAGAFQISDGIQVLSLGALRGLKDATRPMITNLVSYWLIGLPCGWLLAFRAGLDGVGLWWGLVIGLSVAALLHTVRFRKLTAGPIARRPGITLSEG